MPCEKYKESIPKIRGEYMSILLWLANLFMPGMGTMASSCLGEPNFIMDQAIVGFLQNLTAPCCGIGIFWSMWWGGLIYKKHWGQK